MDRPLPIQKIFDMALKLPFENWRLILKVSLPLFVIGLIALTIYQTPNDDIEVGAYGIAGRFILAILVWITFVMAVVGCHRIFLLGPDSAASTPLVNWTGNEIRYIGWSILIGICTSLVSLPFSLLVLPVITSGAPSGYENSALVALAQLTMMIPVYYFVSRWSLFLPASAIDKRDLDFHWAWSLSKGNGWRLALLVGILPLLMDTLLSLIPFSDSFFLLLFQYVLWYVVGVIQVCLLSLSYDFLSEDTQKNGTAM